MQIVNLLVFDKQGRISINFLFDGHLPDEVDFYYDDVSHEVVIAEHSEATKYPHHKVDQKGRVVLPAWLRKYIKIKGLSLYVVIEDDEYKIKALA